MTLRLGSVLEQDVDENIKIFTRAWLLANDAAPIAKRWPVSYRLDTMQIWEQDAERRKLGLHIEIDPTVSWSDTAEPWCIMCGPFVLERHHYLHRAVTELCTRVGNSVAWAQWHIDTFGYPCHADCDC